MNVEIGAEAAQFPEKEYINGIAVAVHALLVWKILACLHWSKRKIGFVCFYENPTNSKNTSSSPLQMHWSGDFDIE